ncbi:MAG: hypothetical protein NZ898_09735 [Myxococcota bacterium]|nr:hypothetical protein [Myxococcota bacterium]MDW8363555.1 M17 family peptidase N-terminal domain-containing protein [Myxococcales bacterium]
MSAAPPLRLFPVEPAGLDGLRTEAFAAAFFEDDLPFAGALGLVDWRLAGALSRLVIRGRLVGRRGERWLLPGRPRLGVDRLLVVGLGAREEASEASLREATRELVEVLGRMGVRSFACALPGRVEGLVDAERSIEWLLEATAACGPFYEVAVFDEPASFRVMQTTYERVLRRFRALLEPLP